MLRDELLALEYIVREQTTCKRCQEPVEIMAPDSESKGFILNPMTHESRPGWLHSLGCGKNPQKDFEQTYPQVAPVV